MSERLYYEQSFLSSFAARVASIREFSRAQGHSLWQIALDRTAFYPTSGGQPHDLGTLTATSPSGVRLSAAVLGVEEDEEGEVWHTSAKPLAAGTAVAGEIDWPRRMDHMQQHSGQHLLSAVFYRETGYPTVSFHLGEKTSTIDLAGADLKTERLEQVEELANRIIFENRPVSTRTVARDEAEELLQAGILRKLPERDGFMRLIEIENLDLNACGGTHVHSTGQIGGLLLRGSERVKGGLRVEFVCGTRAVRSARQDLATLNAAGSALSVGRELVPEAVGRLLAENKAAGKDLRKLQNELLDYRAVRLLAESPVEKGLRIVRRTFSDLSAEPVKMLAAKLSASAPETCALLACTVEEPARVFLASSSDLAIDCGKILRNVLAAAGLRGGGTATTAQGQVPTGQLDAVFSAIEAELRSAQSDKALRSSLPL